MNLNNINFSIKNSPWPLLMTLNLFNFLLNMIFFMNMKFNLMIILLMINNINLMIMWLSNLIYTNHYMNYMNFYLKITKNFFLMMFIFSELMIFSTFFYINFSFSLFNNFNMNFFNLNFFNLNFFMALTNSMILISSSLTIMYSMYLNNLMKYNSMKYLKYSIYLSIYFIMIQLFEYKFLYINISNSIIISNFFMLTSFHMIHVMMGMTIMMIFLFFKKISSMMFNIEFKMICIYWHFIDLIWIFIFIFIY